MESKNKTTNLTMPYQKPAGSSHPGAGLSESFLPGSKMERILELELWNLDSQGDPDEQSLPKTSLLPRSVRHAPSFVAPKNPWQKRS